MRASAAIPFLLLVIAAGLTPGCGAAPAAASELVFTAVPPCRIINTHCTNIPANLCTPHVIAHGPGTYTFQIHGPATDFRAQGGSATGCGIPDAVANHNVAKAIAVNIVAAGGTGAGDLKAWPADQSQPGTSVINFSSLASNGGLNIANGIILPICDDITNAGCAQGDITVRAESADAYLIADVTGYFSAEATDITAVNSGTGLSGGGGGPSVTLSLLSAYQLPQGCTSAQVPSWTGSAWTCATVGGGGGGTVTSITAGSGLTGGTITTSGTIAASFGGNGSAATLSRSDHTHLGQAWSGGGAAIGLRVATTDAASVGLQGETSSATGAGVVAKGSGSSGVALQIQNGGLQVLGADIGSSTAAFIHQATGANTFADATLTSLPEDQDLLLFITPNGGKAGCVEDGHAVGARWVPRSGSIPGSWWIFRADGNPPANNACYNVLVIKP